jgi:hypothetical protein
MQSPFQARNRSPFVSDGGGGGGVGPTVTKNCAGQITASGGYPAPPSVTKDNAGQITAEAA